MGFIFTSVGFFLILVIISLDNVQSLKTFTFGYNGKNLPPGGWTRWLNADHPSGLGDYETLSNVVREYGNGCQGVPCRHPIGVKVLSTRNYSPGEEGDRVYVSPRRGLTCSNHHQRDGKCADYQIRFYCPGMHKLCRKGHKPRNHKHKSSPMIYLITRFRPTTPTMMPEIPQNFDNITKEYKLKIKMDKTNRKENDIANVPKTEYRDTTVNKMNPKLHKKLKLKKQLYKKEVAAQTDEVLLSGKANGFFDEDTDTIPLEKKKDPKTKLKRHYLHP